MSTTVALDEGKLNLLQYKGFYIATPDSDFNNSEKEKYGHFSKITVWWPSTDKKSALLLKKALEKTCCKNASISVGGLAQEGDDEFPDIAIIDLAVFNMDMIRATRSVHADLPIIAIGHLESDANDRAYASDLISAGADDYVVKPVSAECLSNVIEEILTLKQISRKTPDEKRVMGVMVPIMEYTVMKGEMTVHDAIEAIKASFRIRETSGRFLDTIHRSVLVMDSNGGVEGIVTIRNLISSILPDYLKNLSYGDSKAICYSSLFWKGRFSTRLKRMAELRLRDIMAPPPPLIDACSTLQEAALKMMSLQTRRLVVVQSNEVIGIIREQDLFFEMEKILRRKASIPIRIKR